MNSKWHAYISFAKSGIRIIGCGLAFCLRDTHSAIVALSAGFFLAELLGIAEELGDNR